MQAQKGEKRGFLCRLKQAVPAAQLPMDEVEYPKGRKLYRLNVALSKGTRISVAGSLDALEDRTEEEIRHHLAQGHIVAVEAPEPEPQDSVEPPPKPGKKRGDT